MSPRPFAILARDVPVMPSNVRGLLLNHGQTIANFVVQHHAATPLPVTLHNLAGDRLHREGRAPLRLVVHDDEE